MVQKKKKERKFDLSRARCTVIDLVQNGAVHLTAGGGILGMELLVDGVDSNAEAVGREGRAEEGNVETMETMEVETAMEMMWYSEFSLPH